MKRTPYTSAACWIAVASLALLIAGCNQVDGPADVQRALHDATHPADDAGSVNTAEGHVATAAEPPEKATTGTKHLWDAIYLQGSKVGYTHTTISDWLNPADGKTGVRIEFEYSMSVVRQGVKSGQRVEITSYESPPGRLRRFVSLMSSGGSVQKTEGEVSGDELKLTMQSVGKKTASSIPWSDDVGGYLCLEQSLTQQPLKPGETRTLKALQPVINEIGTVRLTARDYQYTQLLGRSEELLKVDSVVELSDGKALPMTIWTDRVGEIHKSQNELLHQETYRVDRREALSDGPPATFDIVRDLNVKLDQPLYNPHGARQMRYRVQLTSSDPAKVFVNDLSQRVKLLDLHNAELLVQAIRPGQPATIEAGLQSSPRDADREPNTFVQSDDPLVAKMAAAAAGEETDPWKLAVRLEKYVHDVIHDKDFGRGDLATAADIAADPHGDCRAHAVLLAALARANKIPARVALGLVYVERLQAFGFHMWTEAWIDDRWIPLDATLGRGGIGAGHIKLTVTNLQGPSPHLAFLPVAQTAGQLKISVVDDQ